MGNIKEVYGRWGEEYPNDFHHDDRKEGYKVKQKWFTWTVSSDLAGKSYMKNNHYLVRCRICREESYQPHAVYVCPKKDCLAAVAVLTELLGHKIMKGEDGDWYSSEADEALDMDASRWWHDTEAEADQLHKDTAETNDPGD